MTKKLNKGVIKPDSETTKAAKRMFGGFDPSKPAQTAGGNKCMKCGGSHRLGKGCPERTQIIKGKKKGIVDTTVGSKFRSLPDGRFSPTPEGNKKVKRNQELMSLSKAGFLSRLLGRIKKPAQAPNQPLTNPAQPKIGARLASGVQRGSVPGAAVKPSPHGVGKLAADKINATRTNSPEAHKRADFSQHVENDDMVGKNAPPPKPKTATSLRMPSDPSRTQTAQPTGVPRSQTQSKVQSNPLGAGDRAAGKLNAGRVTGSDLKQQAFSDSLNQDPQFGTRSEGIAGANKYIGQKTAAKVAPQAAKQLDAASPSFGEQAQPKPISGVPGNTGRDAKFAQIQGMAKKPVPQQPITKPQAAPMQQGPNPNAGSSYFDKQDGSNAFGNAFQGKQSNFGAPKQSPVAQPVAKPNTGMAATKMAQQLNASPVAPKGIASPAPQSRSGADIVQANQQMAGNIADKAAVNQQANTVNKLYGYNNQKGASQVPQYNMNPIAAHNLKERASTPYNQYNKVGPKPKYKVPVRASTKFGDQAQKAPQANTPQQAPQAGPPLMLNAPQQQDPNLAMQKRPSTDMAAIEKPNTGMSTTGVPAGVGSTGSSSGSNNKPTRPPGGSGGGKDPKNPGWYNDKGRQTPLHPLTGFSEGANIGSNVFTPGGAFMPVLQTGAKLASAIPGAVKTVASQPFKDAARPSAIEQTSLSGAIASGVGKLGSGAKQLGGKVAEGIENNFDTGRGQSVIDKLKQFSSGAGNTIKQGVKRGINKL